TRIVQPYDRFVRMRARDRRPEFVRLRRGLQRTKGLVGQWTRLACYRDYAAGLGVEEKVFCCLRIGRFGLLRVLVIADIGRTIVFFVVASGREQEFADRRDK